MKCCVANKIFTANDSLFCFTFKSVAYPRLHHSMKFDHTKNGYAQRAFRLLCVRFSQSEHSIYLFFRRYLLLFGFDISKPLTSNQNVIFTKKIINAWQYIDIPLLYLFIEFSSFRGS